ncbi:MAG: 4-hydroxy-tetrahydrodipicolinate reductase [Bacteroidota bacterium]
MKIALIGYGKMGHEIEAAGLKRGHTFPLIIDIDNQAELTPENLRKADVAVDFSHPASAAGHMLLCFDAGVPVVTGTTGWNALEKEMTEACRKKEGALFYASNYSVGVNILFAVNRYLAELMHGFGDYQVSIREVHHTQKLDAPSGTAISLAQQIIGKSGSLKGWKIAGSEGPGDIPVEAVREGEVTGDHTITWDSPIDTLYIGHHAKSRKGFALGAVLAAEFLADKKGVFTMDDLMNLTLEKQ